MLDARCVEPVWLSEEALANAKPEFQRWLFDKASLTQRLSTLSQQRFSVELIKQTLEPLRPEECRALRLAEGSLGFVREVYLCGAHTPWVFARSVASAAALSHSGITLDGLGARSLGELLFSDPAFTRGPLSACRYPEQWLPQALRHEALWARRSCFTQDAVAILVTEVFLPSFWQQLAL